MSTPGIPVESDFRTRAKTNDVPVARLIGFEAKEIAEGRATVTLSTGPTTRKPHGYAPRWNSVRHCGCRDGDSLREHTRAERILHNRGTEDQFLPSRLGGSPQGRGKSCAPRAEPGLRRVRDRGRTRPARRQGSVDLPTLLPQSPWCLGATSTPA
jgi:hypothetical protein